jgi:hypothetical protein
VEELRQRAADPATPPILLVHLASPEEGERFFAARWPEARAVSDREQRLYRGFGLGRGRFGQLFGPATLLAGITHLRHGIGRPIGDPLVMSGWFLVDRSGRLVWADRHAHAGSSHPWPELLAAAAAPDRPPGSRP